MEDWGFGDWWLERVKWEHKFALFPRRCAKTNKSIWLKKGYKGTVVITGPGDPIKSVQWVTEGSFLLLALKDRE